MSSPTTTVFVPRGAVKLTTETRTTVSAAKTESAAAAELAHLRSTAAAAAGAPNSDTAVSAFAALAPVSRHDSDLRADLAAQLTYTFWVDPVDWAALLEIFTTVRPENTDSARQAREQAAAAGGTGGAGGAGGTGADDHNGEFVTAREFVLDVLEEVVKKGNVIQTESVMVGKVAVDVEVAVVDGTENA